MEENKTTRVNRTVNYYSDRPDYDRHIEKHNCHCERPHYDHCPEKPEYDHYPERPHYDHCPERPEYDHYPVRPNYDHYPVKPEYDHHPVRPNYDHYPVKPEYDHHPVRPNHDHCPERPEYDHHPVRPNHGHCPERPEYECPQGKTDCDPCKEKTKPNACCCPSGEFRPNGCNACCEPIDVKCPDINCAVCTPVLVDKVFDFQRIHQGVPFPLSSTSTFSVDARSRNCPCYQDGAPVCIEKITVVYTCLGLSNDEITGNICGSEVTLTGSEQICNTCPTGSISLYNNFTGPVSSNCCCNGKGSTGTLILPGLNASLCNYQYIVEGFIGCEPFTARAPQTPESQSAFLTTPFNVIGDICLPNCDAPVTLKAEFDLKYIARSIVPTTCFTANPVVDNCPPTAGTFSAQILAELLVNTNLYSTKQDVLTVFSAPTKFRHDEK